MRLELLLGFAFLMQIKVSVQRGLVSTPGIRLLFPVQSQLKTQLVEELHSVGNRTRYHWIQSVFDNCGVQQSSAARRHCCQNFVKYTMFDQDYLSVHCLGRRAKEFIGEPSPSIKQSFDLWLRGV